MNPYAILNQSERQRVSGGTFLFDSKGQLLYEHRDPGILGFAANMSQPLSFLSVIDV